MELSPDYIEILELEDLTVNSLIHLYFEVPEDDGYFPGLYRLQGSGIKSEGGKKM